MPRDECIDCERPITASDSFDGRCSPCHIAFLSRRPEAKEDVKGEEE